MRYDYHYVIVGAGMAADSAARGIRAEDPDGAIVLLGQDTDQPYERPPLSKNLWTDDEFAEDQVFLNTAGDTGAHVHTDTRVTAIDPRARTVTTSGDDVFHYRKLLIATGGTPRELNLAPSPNVIYFRSLSDYHRLRAQARAGAHIVVIGGGFIGTELACALATTEADVTFVTPDPRVGFRSYPLGIQERLTEALTAHGATIAAGRTVSSIAHDDDPGDGKIDGHSRVVVTLEDDSTIVADAVVAGLGIIPDLALAEAAGLTIDGGGIVVDEHLRTSDPDIYAAGDIAYFADPRLGQRRVEHVDQAQSSGRAAGRAMAGATEPYENTPYFYSDLFSDGYEAVGILDTRSTMVEDWAPGQENAQGVVYYVSDGSVRGVLLWNVWDSVDKARDILAEFKADGSLGDPHELIGRIPTA